MSEVYTRGFRLQERSTDIATMAAEAIGLKRSYMSQPCPGSAGRAGGEESKIQNLTGAIGDGYRKMWASSSLLLQSNVQNLLGTITGHIKFLLKWLGSIHLHPDNEMSRSQNKCRASDCATSETLTV